MQLSASLVAFFPLLSPTVRNSLINSNYHSEREKEGYRHQTRASLACYNVARRCESLDPGLGYSSWPRSHLSS